MVQRVRDKIGQWRAGEPRRQSFTQAWSGKILRKLLRQIAANESVAVPSTIDDPSSVSEIETLLERRLGQQAHR